MYTTDVKLEPSSYSSYQTDKNYVKEESQEIYDSKVAAIDNIPELGVYKTHVKQEFIETVDHITENDNVEIPEFVICKSVIKNERVGCKDSSTLRASEHFDCINTVKTELDEVQDYVENEVQVEETDICAYEAKEELSENNIVDFKNILQVSGTEDTSNFYCTNCKEKYKLFCWKCDMVSCILDNIVPGETIPRKILKIKEFADGLRVFSSRALPEGIKFGPFDGLDSSRTQTGRLWKLKGAKLTTYATNPNSLTWTQHVNCAKSASDRNLAVFQHEGRLHYRTDRKINRDEELLAYYGEEHAAHLGTDVETYYYPPVEDDEDSNVYACTYCCLGFTLQIYLIKHKTKCPYGAIPNLSSEDIVQCPSCKIHLDTKEYCGRHVNYCSVKYAREITCLENGVQEQEVSETITNFADPPERSRIENYGIDVDAIKRIAKDDKKHNCPKCIYRTNSNFNFKRHLSIHEGAEPPAPGPKKFGCPQCSYGTNQKGHLRQHLRMHDGIKPYACEVCSKRFGEKATLKKHCVTHSDEKPFACHNCDFKGKDKQSISNHIKNKHLASLTTNRYKCAKCSFETRHIKSLRLHFSGHDDTMRPHECQACGKRFRFVSQLKRHALVHSNEKPFSCRHCGHKATKKALLIEHALSAHRNESDGGGGGPKIFKCPKCDYETNNRGHINAHVNIHEDVKPFGCEVCGKCFSFKSTLNRHKVRHGEKKSKR